MISSMSDLFLGFIVIALSFAGDAALKAAGEDNTMNQF